ncbi:MAG TPA: hypothetical protein VGK78_14735 [Nocardioides sp.]|uniref:hypothetical protein n=1 Tax=Nocardioides sp. TaxID=35761 RepID=UPI002F408B8E
MSNDQYQPGPSEGAHAGRRPLFDPYTGERLVQQVEEESAPDYSATHRAPEAVLSVGPKRGSLRIIAAALAVAVLCGVAGLVWWIHGPHAAAQASAKKHAAAAAEQRRSLACQKLLHDSFQALQTIDSRLDVGMVESDFTSAVGEAQAKYDEVDTSTVSKNHCGAYQSLGAVLKQYSRASSYWNSCIITDYCTPSEVTLNKYWGRSSTLLDKLKGSNLGTRTVATDMTPAYS